MTASAEKDLTSAERRGDTPAHVTSITDALNQITRFIYDPVNGNLLSTIDPLNHATNIAYDQFGQPISVTDALNHTTTFEYNEVGDLITTVDPLGNRTLRFYDAVSRLIAMVDGRGKGTTFTYDHLNRVTQIQDSINGVTTFTYDPNGNLLTVTDAKNQTTTYTYDNMDRLATRKDALNRTESYQYDLAGNLTQFTDRKNQVSTFQYDALNRRIGATYTDSSTTFTYDSVSRLTRASDSLSGTIDRSYDILDRLIQETTSHGTITSTYDNLRRRTSSVVNGQTAQTYNYDTASRLIGLSQGAQTITFGYDAADRRTSFTYPNGISVAYGYDAASRITSVTHQGASGPLETLTYTLDPTGNRISLSRNAGSATTLPPAIQAAYDAANEQVRFNSATPNLTYDADGNEREKGTGYFSGDLRGRPRGRSVETRPSRAAILACQSAVPNGCWRLMQVRRLVRRFVGWKWDREGISECWEVETRPAPVSRVIDELRSYRIEQHIAEHGEQMMVLLNRETLEAPLPDMAMTPVMPMIATDVTGHPPLHEGTEAISGDGRDHEMKMVGHHAETQDVDRMLGFGHAEQLKEGRLVGVFMEDVDATIVTVQHDRHGRGCSHGECGA